MVDTFPTIPGLLFPFKRTPNFTTIRYESLSGKRIYAPKQAFPRWRWELPINFLRAAAYGSAAAFSEYETLVGFFNKRSADGAMFKYLDRADNAVTAQNFGTGDGATLAFQLYRSYGGFTEPVYSATATNISVDGVTVDPANYTVSSKGVVTFAVAPANLKALTWTGTFYWLCRFDDDSLTFQEDLKGLWKTSKSLSFSSELFP